MKTLIVENQWQLEEDMVSLLEEHGELFKDRTEHFHAIQLPEKTGQLIAQHDALLICTFFYYKEQLERLVSGFYKKAFGPKVYKVYARGLLGFLDTWTMPGRPNKTFYTNGVLDPDPEYDYEARRGFTSEQTHKRFLREIISLVSKGNIELYCWDEDFTMYDSRTGQEVTPETPREFKVWTENKWAIKRVAYDKKLKRFHYVDEQPKDRSEH